MNRRLPAFVPALIGLAAIAALAPAHAQISAGSATGAPHATVQVTATRFGETVQEVPLPMSVVSADELRARGATDLRTALALLGGVSVATGGDGGPAGAVPGLLGARELDDLLLLIDGVPAGGAFSPTVEAISLVNVERIEVLRGTAPVYFGTTAFAGTINVIHYAAGKADRTLTLRYGSFGSIGASGALVLAADGPLRQSASLDLADDRYSGGKSRAQRAQGAWRGAAELGGGQLRADLNLMALRQRPGSPSPVDEATGQLHTLLPRDYNQNPADARIDTDRQQLVLGYELPLGGATWGSTLSYTETHTDAIRGFIDLGDTVQPWTAATVADAEAYHQWLRQRDLFIDSHVNLRPMTGVDLTAGVNLLTGQVRAHSLRYAHKLTLDGVSSLPDVAAVNPKTDVLLRDQRRLFGLYAQGRMTLADDLALLAGLRWNDTHEHREEHRLSLSTNKLAEYLYPDASHQRPSGSLGLLWKAWQPAPGSSAIDAVSLHASLGNTFQLAQLGLNPGPESRPVGRLLDPETQRSLILGLKADALQGRAEVVLEGFFVDFSNQPVISGTTDLGGGRQRFKGLDLETSWHPERSWTVVANLGWSDARYRDFVTDVAGTPTQLSGKQQSLVPRLRATAGLVYAPERGWRGSLTASHTGRRWLDEMNTARAAAYTVMDASIGYRFDRLTLQLSGSNLGNRRDPVAPSELGEGQFYRLQGRRVTASVSLAL